jgi:hypothetical protein
MYEKSAPGHPDIRSPCTWATLETVRVRIGQDPVEDGRHFGVDGGRGAVRQVGGDPEQGYPSLHNRRQWTWGQCCDFKI